MFLNNFSENFYSETWQIIILQVKCVHNKEVNVFVGRERELKLLRDELGQWKRKTAVLVYGKRRVGKSTLIREVASSFEGVTINHLCVASTFEGNLDLLYKSVSESLSLPTIHYDSIFAMFDYLGKLDRKILLIIDEYPYLKETGKKNEVNSYMQRVIDSLPGNVKLILCGSYITIMKELLMEDNPLFGRFSLLLHLRDFDYRDASCFYSSLPVRDKIAFYAVFGGCPYVLENIDSNSSLKENIVRLLLPENGIIRSHIENVMLREIRKSYDVRILETLKNGKKRYTEIRDHISNSETGLLDKQLKILLDMETIKKTEPINRKNDKKKQFYEITDNLIRFYFSFIFGSAGTISRINEEQYYDRFIENTIIDFISRRFEEITLQYFHRTSGKGEIKEIEDYGTYWYDDPTGRVNGEFDCVIRRTGNLYDFYECKYYEKPMTLSEANRERDKLSNIKGIEVAKTGFVCSAGFAFTEGSDFVLISGEDLYK